MKCPLPTNLRSKHVKVYLNKKDSCLSLIHRRLVKGHAAVAILKDIAIGWPVTQVLDLIKGNITIDAGEPIEISYDPYFAGHFYKKHTGEPVCTAKLCVVRPSGILAYL